MKLVRSGFNPLLIGLHWPSLPYGDESLENNPASYHISADSPIEQLIEKYAERIANTETTRKALRTIFAIAMDNMASDELPDEARKAYEILNQEAALNYTGVGGVPEADYEIFDPDNIFHAAAENAETVSFDGIGDFFKSLVLAPLQTLSFWKMKQRACQMGEKAGFNLLKKLQSANSHARFHLMGHSFGCIVMSATLAGPNGRGILIRPVNSVALVQGALSLWSYCSDIPVASGQAGYFHSTITDKRKVIGPVITTQSEYDTAVGTMYPPAAGVASQIHFAPGELPKYGALGTYGIQGLDGVINMDMLPSDGVYSFEASKIYNLDGSNFIRKTNEDPFGSGSHNNIYQDPAIAHAVWSAAIGV